MEMKLLDEICTLIEELRDLVDDQSYLNSRSEADPQMSMLVDIHVIGTKQIRLNKEIKRKMAEYMREC